MPTADELISPDSIRDLANVLARAHPVPDRWAGVRSTADQLGALWLSDPARTVAVKQKPPGSSLPDISLMTFLRRQWPTTAADLLECPARLSGALIFNCLGLQGGRINYNANADQQVSHLDMAFLEMVFAPTRGWESLQPPTSADAPEESASTTSVTQ